MNWLIFAHVLAAMIWVGGITVLGALAFNALRDPEHAAPFVASLRRIGPVVLAPAPAILVIFGLWAVAHDPAWSFDQTWVQLGLGLFVAAFVIGAAHQSRAALAAERASTPLQAARHLRRWAYGMVAIVALLVLATWDMIFKPGL
jgi:uncharacterized membrane protein